MRILPSQTDPITASILSKLQFGRMTQAEAAELLGVSRWTIRRYCQRYDLDPVKARAAYLRRQLEFAQWAHSRSAR